jgi:hypothetical protein
MRRPPAWFVRALGVLDPLLSVRASESSDVHWVIERKGVIPPQELAILKRREARLWHWINSPANDTQRDQVHKNRITWMSLKDELVSAQQGKRVVCRPTALIQQVYDDLCKSDFQRYGGYARFCEDLETAEDTFEADQERQLSNKRQAMNGEVYDILAFLSRKRETEMHHGHRDLNYLLHGRHSKPDDKPVIQLTDF